MTKKKLLDYAGLQNFLNKLKGIIPTKTSELQNDSGFITSEGAYDSELSLESEKAVQNKVVTAAINSKQNSLSSGQLDAANSGVTAAKVQDYDSHMSDTDIHVTAADKAKWDSKAAGTHTHTASEVSGLSTVATSGSYNDLSNKPSIPSKTSDLANDSGFLTSHNPVDSALSSTSTNAVQNKVINTELGKKANSADLAAVATSGSYNDLLNKPTIPTVNNATLTIQKNGAAVNTFTANSSSNVTANITVPVNVSELTNDSGYLTSASSLDSSKLTGTIDIARLPKGALERLVTVADQTARFALTVSDVQLGDTVKQLDTGVMYIVSDESKLSSADGYTEYTAGSATSVPWSGVQNKPSAFTPASHTHGSITNDGKLGTASRALITDSSKKIAVSSVTSTELGYLSGVTSAVQTQLNGKSDTGHTHTSSEVSGLATVATSGSYNDLSNKPSIPSKTSDLTNDSGFLTSHNPVDSALSSTSTNAVQNKVINNALSGKSDTGHTHLASEVSGLSTVATSGSYSDLTNKPTIDSALSSTSTNAVQNKVINTELGKKANTTDLATVATSGSYADLTNKPTIPTVNNATLTIQKNGTTVKTFTANSSTNVTADITVPTKVSELTNDSGFLTSHNPVDSSLSSTSTNAVQNKVVKAELDGKADSTHTHTVSDVTDFPTLSTVATSGSYNDLSNKPTIPAVYNKTLTIQQNGTKVAAFTSNSNTNVTANITVPTAVSELTNDSGYLTAHQSLADYSTKADTIKDLSISGKVITYTKGDDTTGTLTTQDTVYTHPTSAGNKHIPSGGSANQYLKYSASGTAQWATIKTSELNNDSGFLTSHNPVDSALSTTSENAVQNKVVKAELDNKANSADLSTVATTGSYSDLNNIPSNFTPASHTHGSITNDGKLGTASRALITDGNKKIAVSSVTSTELGYLSGVTSAVQDQLDGKAASTHSHAASEVSGLATVATSGSYNDLTNKPTIPTVNNATLTIQKNGTTVKTFTANASANVTANITVPTKVSELTNDSGFLTSHNPVDSALSDTSTNAVQNKIVKGALDGKSDTGHTHTKSEITDFPTLATVATSGSYNDLSNKPTIPTVNNATLTIQKNGTTVKTFTANASSNVTANITVPTKVSELTNDSGFLTSASNLDSSKLTGTIDIDRLPKGALERLVTVADQTTRFALTTSDVQLGDTVKQLDTGVMYIVTDESNLSSADGYTEYTAGAATSVPWSGVTGKPSSYTPASHSHGNIANGGTLGTASRALITDGNKKITTSSVTSTELGYVSGVTSAIQTQLDGKAPSSHTHAASEVSGLATVATSGSYNDLSNKPTIDSALSSTSTNAVQNKVINTALAGKAASSHTHTKSQITDFPTKTSQFTNDSHQTITVGTDTTSAASPAHSGTFTCIDSVTRDSNGHVTAVNTKTVTLPADNNTDTKVTNTLGTTTKAYVTGTTSATTNTGTQIFDTGVYLSTTAGELVATKFTGALNGNANTATQFSANKDVTLTGDVTGTASSKAGWSVATTLSDSGVTAGTYGPSADVTGNNNATISVPEITVDSKGRVTSVANRTLTCKNNTYNVYNKTLTIQKNGTNVATFTSNSNTNVTANIVVPTKTSDLTNDSGFLTEHQSLSNYVTLDTKQTISAVKTISAADLKFSTTETRGTAPSADISKEITTLDSAGNGISKIGAYYYTDKHSETRIYAYKTTVATGGNIGYLGIGCNTSGNVYTFAPTPATSDDSTQIATTAYVKAQGYLTSHQSLANYSTLANTVKSLSISGKTITVTPGSGSAYTLTTQDTVYTHPTTAGNKHIPSGGAANQYLKYSASGTAVWADLPSIPTKTSDLTNDSHQTIATTSDTTSTDSPTHSGTFTCIDSVTRDSNGHVTTVNTKTVTLPADSNTDTKVTQTVTTGNSNYPIILGNTASQTATETSGARFTAGAYINARYATLRLANVYNSDALKGTRPASTRQNLSIQGYTKDDALISQFKTEMNKAGLNRTFIETTNWIKDGAVATDGTATTCGLYIDVLDNGTKQISTTGLWASDLTPVSNNSKSLGTSDLRWKECYANAYFLGTTAFGDIVTHNASEFLTSHQSLANYSTLANTVKSISISGKTITVTPGSGSAYTLTTQDTVYTHPTTSGNKHIPSGGSSGKFLGWDSDGTAKWVNNPNSDTLMTQNVSTTNNTYPVLLCPTADATSNQGAKTGIFAKSVKINPNTNTLYTSNIQYTDTLYQYKSGYTKGEAFTSNVYLGMAFKDSVGSQLADILYFQNIVANDGKAAMEFRVFGNANYSGTNTPVCANLGCGVTKDNEVFTFAPTPATADNSTQIATTAFVKAQGYLTSHQSLAGYLPLTGGTMTGDLTIKGATLKFSSLDTTEGSTTYRTDTLIKSVSSNTKYGLNVLFGSSGGAILGAGEGKDSLLAELAGTSPEDVYIIADSSIHFHPGANTYANKKTITLDGSANLSGLSTVTATTFSGNVTGNCSGTAANVTGTVAIANGGTGATDRLNAFKNLTSEAVSSPTHFIGITSNWAKVGYTTIAQAKSVLGVPTKTSQLTNNSGFLTSHQSLANYVTLDSAQTITGSKDFSSNSYVTVRGYRFRVKNDSIVLGTTPSSNQWTGFSFIDKDDNLISEIIQSYQASGNSLFQINVFPNETNSEKRSIIAWQYNSASGSNFVSFTSDLVPQSTNTYDLGTSTNKWKESHAVNFYENGTTLTDKYVQINQFTNKGTSLSAGVGTIIYGAADGTKITVGASYTVSAINLYMVSHTLLRSTSTGYEQDISLQGTPMSAGTWTFLGSSIGAQTANTYLLGYWKRTA